MEKIVQVQIEGMPFAVSCLDNHQFDTVINSKGKRTTKGRLVTECAEIDKSTVRSDEGILTFEAFITLFPK